MRINTECVACGCRFDYDDWDKCPECGETEFIVIEGEDDD